ncbi:hypothetical protein [Neotabrizicola sp. sgz301269]|uniref:hypothetical protein n=1 Tax=Neotabrizicola sp. sgz301269 TaxID=3276282 RepID=UPI00376F5A11
MSGVYEQAEREREQKDLADHLKTLIDTETVKDQPELGITKQVIDKGRDSLSDKQEWVFKTKVYDPYCDQKCELCGERIPVSEAWDFEAGDLQHTCSSCRHDLENFPD